MDDELRVVARFYAPLSLRGLPTMLEWLERSVGTRCYMGPGEDLTDVAFTVVTRGEPLRDLDDVRRPIGPI